MSKECSIINDANGSESELYYKLIDALGSEKLAEEEYDRVRGEFFRGTLKEPGVFGDWIAVQKLKDDPNNKEEIPHIGKVNPNGEPQLHYDRTTNLHYYINRNEDRHYVNARKFPLLREEEIEEATRSLLFGFVNNNRKKDFNDFDEATFLKKGEMITFIESYVRAYQFKVAGAGLTDEQTEQQMEAANLILEYKDDFKRAVIDRLEALGTKFRETVSNEIDEKSNDLQQTIRESYETSAKDSATANTKILLSKIENVEEVFNEETGEFEGLASVPGDFLGMSTFVEFNEVWTTLQPALADIVSFGHGKNLVDVLSQMKVELRKIAKVKPWAQKLAQDLETMDQNKLNEFIQAFSKTKLNFYVTEVNGSQYKVINATSTTQADTQISKAWGLAFQNRHLDDSGSLKDSSKIELKAVGERIKQLDKLFAYSDKAEPSVLSEAVTEAAPLLLEILHAQGVHEELYDSNDQYIEQDGVTEQDLNQFITLNGGVEHTAREFKRLIKAAKKTNEFILSVPEKGFLNAGEWTNPFTQEMAMKHLANAFSVRQNNVTDNAILANEGKTYYPYSNPMYLSSKINEWKREIKAKDPKDESPTALDRLALRPENENSTWIAYLQGKDKGIIKSVAEQRATSLLRLNKLNMGLANSFKSKAKNDGVGNTDITFNDAINDHITKLLGGKLNGGKSYFATITPADKGRRVELEGLPVFETKAALLDDVNFAVRLSSSTIDLLEGYFLDEYNRMRRVARENESLPDNEKIVHYHGKEGNGLKSQIFPELSHESKAEEYAELRSALYNSDGTPMGDLNSVVFTSAQKTAIRSAIQDTATQRIKETRETIDQLDNVNSAIYKSYNTDGKKSKPQVNTAIAADYFVNGLISTVEYGKMFSGDPAYYKNPSDLIKRIPATYTDGLQLRLGTSDELKFNTATINAIEGKSKYYDKIYESLKDKSIADAYTGVNVTDAQAWITPNRWKFLKRRLGQWSKFHDKVYDKMMKGQTLKPNEIKIAAQPLKGVYFDMNAGRPVYLKYSQAVLLPHLVKNTPMQGLYDKMTKDADGNPYVNEKGKGGQNEIHEVITLDGVKVGAIAPTTIHDDGHNLLQGDNLELNVVQLDNRGWKLQQDLPIKKIHDTNVGSQIQKNIIEGLQLDKMYGEISGQDLLQKIHDTVSGLSDHGKAELEEMFDIKDGRIQNEDKIYDELLSEFISRGADDNVIQALRKKTPFDSIPQIKGKVQSVLMSMFNKRLTKISTPGGSFIQVSPFGLETIYDAETSGIKIVSENFDGKGLQPPRIDPDTGEVLRGQVFMPHSEIVKLLKDVDGGKDFMSMSGVEIMEYLTPEVLQIISYRIPNQGMSSNDALEIVGILPPEMGDAIIGYDGIPAKTGSDFDIDKMYVMTRNIELRDGKIQVTEPEEGSKEFLQNQLVDLYESILLDPKTYDKMMTSIDGAFLKEDIAGTRKNPEKGLFPAPIMKNMEMFSPVQQMKTKFEYLSGKTGVGKTAVHLVDHASNQSLDVRLNVYLGVGKKKWNEYSRPETLFDQGTDGNNSIAESLSAFLNAYVDIAKDPYIARANHNDTTAPVTFMLLRAGVDLKWINRFIGQPILKEAVEGASKYMSITSKSGALSPDMALQKSFSDIRTKYKLNYKIDGYPNEVISSLDQGEMEDRIRDNKTPLGSEMDLRVIEAFEYLANNARNFGEAVAAARADTKGGQGSFVERQIMNNKLAGVFKKGSILGYGRKFAGTALGTYHQNSVTWVGDVLNNSDLFWAGSRSFSGALNNASNKFRGEELLVNADFGAKLENAAVSYLMSGSELFIDNNNNMRLLFSKLGQQITELKKTSDNYLIKELQVEKFNNKNFIKIDNNNKPRFYKNKIYREWLELYADPSTKELALNLVKYSFASSGFQSRLGSFFTHVPHEILRDEGLTRDVRARSKELERLPFDENYFSQTARHNAEDTSVVKRVSPNVADIRFGVNVKQGGFVLDNMEFGAREYVSAMIDGEVALYKLHGFVQSESNPDMRDGVYIRTHKLGMKESKGGAVEYKYDTESKKSSFEANNLTTEDKNAMRVFLGEVSQDRTFVPLQKELGMHKAPEKITAKEQAKKVGNAKEVARDASSIEASNQLTMKFENEDAASANKDDIGDVENATHISLDMLKANMKQIKKDNNITENNCKKGE